MDNTLKNDFLTEQEKEMFMPNLDICFDWVQVTFQGIKIEEVINYLFCVDIGRCTRTNSGRFGYNETYTVYSKCHVMRNTKNSEMGVHVLFSGSACREYELCFTWDYFFKNCEMMNGKFTRVDIAIDCYKKYFTVNQLYKKVRNGELVSKFRKTRYTTEIAIKEGNSTSASLTFGSHSSDIYIVIYDKLQERMNAGYTVKSGIEFWTRCELRFKHDLSNQISKLYLDHDFELSQFVFNVLYNYLDFKDKSDDTNKSRWVTSSFWTRFLGDCEKQVISVKAFQSTIQKKKEYTERCLNKLLSMLYVCDNQFIRDLIKGGMKKINEHDLAIINSFMIENNMKVITVADLQHQFDDIEQLQLFKCGV